MTQDFLYKFYDVPNLEKIQKTIWNHIPDNYKKLQLYVSADLKLMQKCKELVEAIDSFHSWDDVYTIGIIIAQPNSAHNIHTDSGFPLVQNKYCFNIPIANTENTDTIFYKLKEGKKAQFTTQKHGDPYLKYDEADVEEIERFVCIRPCFLNTQVPHKVLNPLNSVRALITVRCRTPFNFEKIFNSK
jgi:hypothetical protein